MQTGAVAGHCCGGGGGGGWDASDALTTRTLPERLETREAKSQSMRLLTEEATQVSSTSQSVLEVTAVSAWTGLLSLTVSARLLSPGGKYNQDKCDAVSATDRDVPNSLAPTKGHSGPSGFPAKTGYSERCFERTAKVLKRLLVLNFKKLPSSRINLPTSSSLFCILFKILRRVVEGGWGVTVVSGKGLHNGERNLF